MNVEETNLLLSLDNSPISSSLPRLKELSDQPFRFQTDFGLPSLPQEPGVLFIRGPRQFGKSTWLESQILDSYLKFGPASAFYLNGDEIALSGDLLSALRLLIPRFNGEAAVKRLFIDEITAIEDWERSIKILYDQGELRDILIVSTGSKATDIRRGSERLPGRKGKLARTNYIFTPLSFQEYQRGTNDYFKENSIISYILSGGSPLAANELARNGFLPEYVIALTRDWILGETIRTGRQRATLLRIFEVLHKNGGRELGYTKLAREVNAANNTVVSGYLEVLEDLLSIAPVYQAEPVTGKIFPRKACKFHFINSLVAVATSPYKPWSIEEFEKMPEDQQGVFYESLVAQELWRRNVLKSSDELRQLKFLHFGDNEIDFVLEESRLLEVKRGQASPHEFNWLFKNYPDIQLQVISKNRINFKNLTTLTMEEFLLGAEAAKLLT